MNDIFKTEHLLKLKILYNTINDFYNIVFIIYCLLSLNIVFSKIIYKLIKLIIKYL